MRNKAGKYTQLFVKQVFANLALLFILFFATEGLQAQQVKAILEPDSIVIGKRAVLRVEVSCPSDSQVIPVALNDTIFEEVEIFSASPLDTLRAETGDYFIRQEFVITAWEEGFYPIAPIPVLVVSRTDTLEVYSAPLLLKVYSVEVSEDATPYDIKPIFRMPLSIAEMVRVAGPAILLLALFAGLAWWFYKQRKGRPQAESICEKPGIPPHIAAISSLENLKNKKLWENGKVKLYHSELTYIVRMFLEKRFGLLALEMTSGEILKAVEPHLKGEDMTDSLKVIFELADLVKFAKFSPEPQQNEKCMELALDFVKRNFPSPVAEEKKYKQGGEE
jgi:hypothetical protein